MNDTKICSGVALLFFALIVALGARLIAIHEELSGMREAVTKCESVIPRNQKCRIVYSAEVVK